MPKAKPILSWPPADQPRWVSRIEVDARHNWSTEHRRRQLDQPPWVAFGVGLERSWSAWWDAYDRAKAGLAPMPSEWTLPGVSAVVVPALSAPAALPIAEPLPLPELDHPPELYPEPPVKRKRGRQKGSKNKPRISPQEAAE